MMKIHFLCKRGPDRAQAKAPLAIPLAAQPSDRPSEVLLGKAGADVVLDDDAAATCSRRHAVMNFDTSTNEVTLKDIGSSNGTFVNCKRVTSAILKNGDEVIFGGGQSIPLGEYMTLEQQSHPMITVWQVEISLDGSPEETHEAHLVHNIFAEGKDNEHSLNLDTGTYLNPMDKLSVQCSPNKEGYSEFLYDQHEDGLESAVTPFGDINRPPVTSNRVYHTPIQFNAQRFDEIMPRAPHSIKLGSFITRKVKKVSFDECAWKWVQESPNPHEFGQFITLVVNVNEISCIKYSCEHKVSEQFQGIHSPFFLRIDILSSPQRVIPDVYLSEFAKLRMEGHPKEELTMSIIFFFKRKSEVLGLVEALKENYAGGNMSERIVDITAASEI